MIPLSASAVTVEISKSYEWDVLYFESDLDKTKNNILINYFSKFNLKEVVRPINNCDRIDYTKKTNTCFRIKNSPNGLDVTYRNLQKLKKKSFKNFNSLEISDFLYTSIFNTESPFLTNFVFSGQSVNSDGRSVDHSIFISNINGSKVKKLFSSKKSIISLAMNPDKKTLAYISYENIYPTIFLHDIYLNERISLKKIPGKINSVNWDLSGDNLLISIKNNEEHYNLYKFNIKTNQFSKLTNFKFDIINPTEVSNGVIVYTSIKDRYPSAYISNFNKRTTSKLRVSDKFLYISDIYSKKGNTLAIAKQKGTFSLLFMKDANSSHYDILFKDEFIESPKIMKNNSYLMLTSGSDFGNTVSIVDTSGNINKEISFKNIKVTELEII